VRKTIVLPDLLSHFTKASGFGGRGPVQEPTVLLFWVLNPALGLKGFAFTRKRP